jgi:hypothetical protein
MLTKSIINPVTKKSLFFGRNRPRFHFPRLSIKNYLGKALPNPPPSWNWRRLAMSSISQMYLNDTEGDCVIAEMCHSEGIFTGNANGGPVIFTPDQVNTLYSAIGGYVPGDPSTDNGCDIQTALSYWGNKGLLNGELKNQGYLAVNPSDKTEIQIALFLFENLCFGVELPDAWINPVPEDSGFIWDVAGAPDPDNGHCFLGFGYDYGGVNISTWAMQGMITYNAIADYCSSGNSGELYTVLSEDSVNIAKSRAPNGFDWTQLLADFQAIKV